MTKEQEEKKDDQSKKKAQSKRESEIKTIAIAALVFSPVIMILIMFIISILNILLFISNTIRKTTINSFISNIGFFDAKEFLSSMFYAAKTGKTNYYGMRKIKSKNPDDYITEELDEEESEKHK